ncbi:alpha-1-macroglobulin-like [Cebus imitator]|uniref:alpha-1-macroglobulin-like n=1 Tax=Cebus imitator TaxID=2715852 RepID=UPI0018972D7B|nr:alpha-1-macroglobulin-like [Cebus imitator]
MSSLQVNLRFSSAQSLPASDNRLKVTATPFSLCALCAVDQSVLLMKPEAELSPQSVYNLLPIKSSSHTFRVRSPGVDYGEDCLNAKGITHEGTLYVTERVLDWYELYSIFMVIPFPKNITKVDLYASVKVEKQRVLSSRIFNFLPPSKR